MTDLEMTRLCAEAMGLVTVEGYTAFDVAAGTPIGPAMLLYGTATPYVPLHNDVQVMALVKRFKLHPVYDMDANEEWECYAMGGGYGKSADLNRAIVECVAALPLRIKRKPNEQSPAY